MNKADLVERNDYGVAPLLLTAIGIGKVYISPIFFFTFFLLFLFSSINLKIKTKIGYLFPFSALTQPVDYWNYLFPDLDLGFFQINLK
jgi:hypothetical protein